MDGGLAGLEDTRFLSELLLLIAIATAGVAIFERLRLPSIAAFLVMGALVGPGGMGLIDDPDRVRSLAELGVVLLLFEIGLELPLERLRQLWRSAVVAGGLQVVATLICVSAIGTAFGLSLPSALVVGALVAMSSTALVMRLLSQRGQIDSPQGQIAVGVLLFQDLCIVPFLLAVPILAAGPDADTEAVLFVFARAVLALCVFYLISRFLLPRLLDRVAQFRSSEVFTMVAFLLVIGSAVVAENIGLTLAVGAFVGGLVLSASPYAHQLFAEVVPLRGLLLGVFFTAVGMLFDPATAAEHWVGVAVWAGAVIVLKSGFVAIIVALALRRGWRLGILAGLALAQTGEFSFVLAAQAAAAGLLDDELGQIFIAGSIVTLVATPFLVQASPWIAGLFGERAERTRDEPETMTGQAGTHVVLLGFGVGGRTIGRVLRAREIPYTAVDANATAVRSAQDQGVDILYGDATRRSILERAGVTRARLVIVVISDPVAAREIVSQVRRLAPETPILARTRYVSEVDELTQLGASQVIAEEFEATLELLGETLEHFGVSADSIGRFLTELRSEGYEFVRSTDLIVDPWLTELLLEVGTQWVEVPEAIHGGTSLFDLDVRARTGATIVAIERDGTTMPNPDASYRICGGDRLLTVGVPEAIERLNELLAERETEL